MGNVLEFRAAPPIDSLRLREIVHGEIGEITFWFRKNKAARARFRIRVGHLRKMERIEWNWKQFHKLDNGLAEIKWESGKKQHRIIGFDCQDAFLMLVGCSHKQDIYDPPGCLETARRLKGEVENGNWNTRSFDP